MSCWSSDFWWVVMPCCIYIIINISVTTLTSVCCISLCCASRSSYNWFIIMFFKLCDYFCVWISTRTSICHNTCCCMSCRNCDYWCMVMTCCIYIIINITVTTFTSICCIALFRAGWGSYSWFIIVCMWSCTIIMDCCIDESIVTTIYCNSIPLILSTRIVNIPKISAFVKCSPTNWC